MPSSLQSVVVCACSARIIDLVTVTPTDMYHNNDGE
jgi:hypothetical protein